MRSSCAMRVASVDWRAAMPASSIAWLRVISSDRVVWSAAMRSAASVCSRAIFAASIAWLAAISASSMLRVRAISSARVRSSEAMRSALIVVIWAMRSFSVASRAAISASSTARVRSISRRRVSSSLTMRDSVTARSCRMRAFSTDFARLDLRLLDRARPLDLVLAHFALGGDARGVDRALVLDARLFDALARGDLDFLDRTRALDLLLPDLALGGDARFADRLLVGDARLFDRLASGNLRLLGLGLAQRALARDLGPLHRAPHLDVALLREAGRLAVALDVERLPLGLEVAGADLDHRILFDVVAQLAAVLDVLHQAGQTLGVETVRGVEEFEIGLVEVGDRDRLELEAVLGQRLWARGFHARDIFAALLVHLLHRHLGGDRAQRGDELAGQQSMQPLGLERAPAERRGGDRHRLARGLDADIEVGLDVDAHAVAGDDARRPSRARSASAARSC